MKLIKQTIRSGWFTLIVLLSACSSHIPPEIRQPLEGAPSVAQVRDRADTYLSQRVRWGGVILNTENKLNASWLTIVAFPLDDEGEPGDYADQSPGRFIAIVDEFLEPTVYNSDRQITVIGNLLRTETLKIGEFPYEYPVVQVEHYYLWPPKPEPADYPPYWYDPWYNPYYPWQYPHYPRRYRR
jgi:outer membrane lipoprotein